MGSESNQDRLLPHAESLVRRKTVREQDRLDGQVPPHDRIVGQADDSHRPAAQFRGDVVAPGGGFLFRHDLTW